MLPEELSIEIAGLEKLGYSITTTKENSRIYLLFSNYPLPDGVYNTDSTDLLIWTTELYPSSNFDMFWVNQSLSLKSGAVPQAAQVMESHLGKSWRRFSIHPFSHTPWDPNQHGVETYLTYVNQRLNSGV